MGKHDEINCNASAQFSSEVNVDMDIELMYIDKLFREGKKEKLENSNFSEIPPSPPKVGKYPFFCQNQFTDLVIFPLESNHPATHPTYQKSSFSGLILGQLVRTCFLHDL